MVRVVLKLNVVDTDLLQYYTILLNYNIILDISCNFDDILLVSLTHMNQFVSVSENMLIYFFLNK